MPRNIRWDESVQKNVLNLVETLLYQADDELDDLALKAAVHVEWVTANKLRVTGKEKQTRRKREQVVEVGTRKEHLVKLVNKTGKSLKLPQRKKESGSSQQERELAEVQTALDCLRELGVFEEEKNTRKNQGYWKFTLTLKHQTATREENLEVVRQKWKEHPKTNSLVTSSTTPILETEKSIDWRDVCRTMLEKQKRLTTNELLSADEDMKFELDDIQVPLALVQRTKPDKRSGDVSPEEGSRLLQPTYEEKQRFRHEEFLAQVLQEGKGQSKGRRIAVIGEPGAGKTTLLQSIAFWLFEEKNKNLGLPIWISLADLQGKTLEEYLLQRWLKNALEVVRVTPEQENALLELFKKERVWLFLDGVDEIAGDSGLVGARHVVPLQMVASHLEGWVAKARVLLSCRLNVWEANINALGDDFETYRLLDFDYPLQVKEFICRWFRKTDAEKGERLWTELDKSERQRIQDLVKNPLRLALLCSTWQSSDKGLPSTKAGLYQRFVEVFYTWKKNRFPTTFEQRQELNAALGRLALRAIDSEVSRFRLRHKFVCEVLGDPEREGSLFGLALQLGWLNKVGLAAESETQEKVYAFYHPTFQEYFAALAIDDWHFFLNHVPHNPTQGNYRIFEPQWKEVILLWLGREEVEREPFIQALVEFKDGCGNFYRYKAYFLAAEGIAEFHNCSQADDLVEQIVKWGFGYFNIKKQKWQKFPEIIAGEANLSILATNPKKSIKTLGELIQTCQDEYIRLTAISTLEEIDKYNSQIINSLVELIQTSQDEGVCWIAAEKLIEVGKANPLAITALIELSTTSQDENIRQIAANMLGEAGENTVSIQSIFEALQIPLDKSNRWELVDGLGEIHKDNPLVINALIELIQPWQDEDTRLKALDLLGKIDKFNPLLITNLIEIIQTSQNEDNPDRAAYVLQRIGEDNPLVITALVELIQTSQDENTRLTAASTLEGIDKYNALGITTLVEIIQTSQDEGIYSIAADILGEIVSSVQIDGVVTALRGCVSDEAYENDFRRYCDCYSVIWHYAENMTYPDFYQTWHQQEGVDNTTTSDSKSLNQADFLQSLQSAITHDPQLSQTIHLIYIDGSQFIDPDRPAAEIYDQMLDQNCPECDPAPETMQALKLYWNSLRRNSDKRPVLVFYASSTEPYSEAFLTDLSKFGGAICCVVTSPPTPLLRGEGSKSNSGSPSS